jgi:hypothetical protein
MADNAYFVNPDAVGAGDGSSREDAYTALETAQAARAKDLVTATETTDFVCLSSGGTADTTPITIGLWTSNSSYFFRFVADTDNEALIDGWDASRYRISVQSASCIYSQLANNNVWKIVGLQLEVTQHTYGLNNNCGIFMPYNSGTLTLDIDSCRMRDTVGPGGNGNSHCGVFIYDGGAKTINIYDTVLENFNHESGGSCGIWMYDGSTTCNAYNCTIYNCAYGFADSQGTTTAKNCAVFKCGNDFNNVDTIDYCASDDDDGTNNVAESGGGVDWPDDFEDAAAGDFTLKATSNLVGGGVDDPGSGLYSDDMEGDARSSAWDVGADEYVGGAPPPGACIPIIGRDGIHSLIFGRQIIQGRIKIKGLEKLGGLAYGLSY